MRNTLIQAIRGGGSHKEGKPNVRSLLKIRPTYERAGLCLWKTPARLGVPKSFQLLSQLLQTPFDLLKHLAVWQLQSSTRNQKGRSETKKSLAHARWNCKYHIVFAPKYRTSVLWRSIGAVGESIIEKLCEWKNVRILEAECCADHIHMLLEIRRR